ncbi:helix-turn-helix transcriptional regulator [Streptomyces sp. NPDC088194]|uniref:helix-turn-helix domain-containing protein n=1 Tax=Streptomyces sp. NPDC088194 TaxID=3154931 RepID=UPI00344EB07B
MDGIELGRGLRARRKAAGRTIASVAMDAGLSVPYIANLENGRGNPTMAALHQLAGALGARLELALIDESGGGGAGARVGGGGGGGTGAPVPAEFADRLLRSPRARKVTQRLAAKHRLDVALVRERLRGALVALGPVLGGEPGERDLDRLLDLLLLSGTDLGDAD